MKHIKHWAGVLLALVMTLAAASVPAMAGAELSSPGGQIDLSRNAITVTNYTSGATYSIYKMLDLVVNDEKTAYSYTVNSNWKDFFTGTSEGAKYVNIDDVGYVTWKDGMGDADDMIAFGKAAAQYAAANNLDSIKNPITPVGFEKGIVFGDLDSGYYLITSTLGSKTIVLTTPSNKEVTVQEKNAQPTIDKKVKENPTGEWGDKNDASVGDTVEFRTTVHAKPGALNYVLHDVMSEGLTLNQNSIEIKVGETTLTKGTDYNVSFENSDKCDFEITFIKTYLDKISEDTDIVVTYSAVLNDKAVISTDANTNKTKLDYSAKTNTSTAWDQTETYTYKFDLVKTDNSDKVLTGATFKLYDAQTGGKEIALVKESDGSYCVATPNEIGAEGFTAATIEAGKVTIKGLDSGTYYLEEVTAPAGYNKLKDRVKVEINGANLDATIESDTWTAGGVQVVNKTGTELPETGGMGTTLFYAVGGTLVLAAVVLLVTRKRMNDKG